MKILAHSDLTCALIHGEFTDDVDLLGTTYKISDADNSICLGNILYTNPPIKVGKISRVNPKLNTLWKIFHMRRGPGYYMGMPLLQMIDPSLTKLNIGINEIIAGAFLNIVDDPMPNHLFVLVRTSQVQRHTSQQKCMEASALYRGFIVVDAYYDLFIFEIPKRFHVQYKLLTEGLYSKLAPEFKQNILTFIGPGSFGYTMGLRLHLDPNLRTQMEERLGITIEKTAELLSPPSESDFYDKKRDAMVDIMDKAKTDYLA